MASDHPLHEIENWHNFQIQSRREIIALLRTIESKNQLVRLLINGEADVAVTSILDVDADNGEVVIDCSINREQNARIVAARRLTFETTLDKIRILFTVDGVDNAQFEGRPSLQFCRASEPGSVAAARMYRMETPLTNPVRCVIVFRRIWVAAAMPSRWPMSAVAGLPFSMKK